MSLGAGKLRERVTFEKRSDDTRDALGSQTSAWVEHATVWAQRIPGKGDEVPVTGQLADDKTALDAVTACFPAGTLSGAPKVRAMELIEEVELTRRGLYGGCVGYLDFVQQAFYLCATQAALGIGEHAASGFKML